MKTFMLTLLALVVLAAAGRSAAASDEDEANSFFANGQRAFTGGHYSDAVNEYQRGYALSKQPRFLLGMARAYETLGDLPRARDYYRRFQAEARKDDPELPSAAAALARIDPVDKGPPPPKVYLDGGRTPEELREALGQDEYERYVASGLTLNGLRQRDAGNRLATRGIIVAVSSLSVGVALILTAGDAGGRALVGYCVAAVGTPIGFWMMRVGFHSSTMANYQIRPSSTFNVSYNPPSAFGSLSFSF